MCKNSFSSYRAYQKFPVQEMRERAQNFCKELKRRRTVRNFSSEPVPRPIIEDCIRAAGSAPSGANRQPWHFVAVSNPEMKKKIRNEAEKQEKEFYERRATEEWLEALKPLETSPSKSFLEEAPYLIAIFAERYKVNEEGKQQTNYYVKSSVGIATGMLITALHHAGLACLTHTPSPMGFLNEVLNRPEQERPFLLLVTGYPAEDVKVPDLEKKSLQEISTFYEE